MSTEALGAQHARGGTIPQPSRARGLSIAFVLSLVALVGAPAVYLIGPYHTQSVVHLHPDYLRHLLFNWACNIGVFTTAWLAKGPVGVRFTKTLYALLLVHGLLAFLILADREFFSQSLMLVAAGVSTFLGACIVLARSRLRGHQVAVLGVARGDVDAWISRIADVIDDPRADLRRYETVVVNMSADLPSDWTSAVARAMLAGCEVRHVAEYLEERRGRVSVEHFHVEHVADRGQIYQVGKRVLDVGVVVFFLPVALVVLGVALVTSLILMGRPVFFVQERVGLGGQPFRMWKLRTMRLPKPGEEFGETRPNDDRIPPFGRILRRLRIDELPQLWNVLVGNMSLIGPRPEAVPFHQSYLRDLPEYAYRNLVRPGITGWAQVSTGPSANVAEARTKLSYDLYYVKKLSFLLDFQIVMRTFWTLASGSGVR